jgi:hypothetical protein
MVILVIAFLLVFSLFQASIRYSNRIETQAMASLIAEKKIEEVRDWAKLKTGTAYNYDTEWSPYSGIVKADTDYPEYQVKVEVRGFLLTSPCASFETAYPGEEKKLYSSSKKVKVTVTCDPDHPDRQVSLTTLIREPRRTFSSMTVTPVVSTIPNPLPKDSTVDFMVTVKDANGNEIKDLFYRWYIEPYTNNGALEPGNGTITYQARHEGRSTFANKVRLPNGTWGYTGG